MKCKRISIFNFFLLALIKILLSSVLLYGNKDISRNIEIIYSFGKRDIFSKGRDKTYEFLKNKFVNYGYFIDENSFYYNIKGKIVRGKNLFAYKGNKKDFIVIGAHYDSKYFKDFDFLGANDNISGIVALIYIGDVLKDINNLSLSIGFLFLDMEEAIFKWSEHDGLYGSKAQVAYWTKTGFIKNIKYFILLDMIGDPNTSFCKDSNSDEYLNEVIWSYAVKNGYHFFKDCYTKVDDDHVPFIKAGIKAVDIIPSPFPYYWHTKDDTIDKISPIFILKIAKLVIDIIINDLGK